MHTQKIQVLRERLNAHHKWPTEYLFKFILQADAQKEAELLVIFEQSIEIKKRESREGKYVSYSIKKRMENADEIFDIYMEANKIEGIITL